MKGDIAFVGFMLTADEWQELDTEARAQLIAVATRRADPLFDPPRRFPDGTGRHEIHDIIDAELDDLLELDADDADSNLEPPSSRLADVPSSVDAGWEDFADLNEI